MDVIIAKGANWAAIRDSLSSGANQLTQMLIGMPLASTMGRLGSPKKPMVIPWLLNRTGGVLSALQLWLRREPRQVNPCPSVVNSSGLCPFVPLHHCATYGVTLASPHLNHEDFH